jgi:membrane associated rhomboid family serine protease
VIGASGAVAGVVAGYLILYPYSKVWILALGRIPLRLRSYWVLGFWVAYQIFQIAVAEPGEIAWWTHVGGFVTGAILVLLLRRRGVVLFGYEPEPDETEPRNVDEAASGPIGSAAPEAQPAPPRGPAE